MAYTGLYNADGQKQIFIVPGTSYTGLMSPDGQYNGVLNDGVSTYVGTYHACGAYNVTIVSDPLSGRYAKNGSLNIVPSSNGFALANGATLPWPPQVNGQAPVWFADITRNRYLQNGVTYQGATGTEATPFNSWLAALSGLFLRSSAKYSVNSSKVLVSQTTNAPCFDYDFNTGAYLGLSIEGARTNDVLFNRDLTNVAWVKSNVTVALDQTGVDGTLNAASSITATAGGGTVTQAITAGSAGRVQSIYVKRLVGSGNVSMSMDGGATFTLIDIVSLWERAQIPLQTLINPSVVIQLATSGDKIAVDFVQNEVGTYISSPILTTAAAATRAEDLLRMGSPGVSSTAASTWLVGISPVDPLVPTLNATLYNTTDAVGTNRLIQLVRNQTGSNNINVVQFVGGSQVTNINDNSNYSFASPARFAMSSTASLTALSVNGAAVVSVNPGSEPLVGNLTATDVGRYSPDGTGHSFDHFQYLGYWTTAASNASLISLATVPGFNLDRSRSLVSQGDSLANASGITDPSRSWLVLAGGTRPTFNNGINGATSTQVANVVLADNNYKNWLNIYWVGHNDILSGVVVSNIQAMIAHQTTTGGKYLVLSPLQNTSNGTGSATYLGTVSLRSSMASTFGSNYVDVASALLANGNGSGADNAAIANGYTPPSLQSDNIHLNNAGYQVIANVVAAKLAANGW